MNKLFLYATMMFALTSFSACSNSSNATNSNSSVSVSQSEGNPIKHIDADFLKKNIYDWEKNPGEFVFKGDRPAIIDFYATWCGPCRRLAPKLEDIANKYKGKIDVYKVDVDDEITLARLFGVKSIPMCLFIPVKGTPVQTQGDLSMEQLEENVGNILK